MIGPLAPCRVACRSVQCLLQAFSMIRIADFPQLSFIAWNRPKDGLIDEEEALALYERNWAYVDKNALTPNEKALVNQLAERYGHDCFAPV